MFEDIPILGKALPIDRPRDPSTFIILFIFELRYDTSVHSIVCCPEIKSERKTDCIFTSPDDYDPPTPPTVR